MGKVDIWMPVYIGDYLRDTEELTGPEHGAYLLLLMHYWQKGGEIGCDIGRLSRVCRSDEETARFILGYYFTLENGNYKNKRADEEMMKAENRHLTAKVNGQKGGRPPKNNPEITARLAKQNRPVSQTEPDHNPKESSSPSPSPSNINNIESVPKESKHKYGEDGNVLLRDSERDKLVAEYGQEAFDSIIFELSSYKAMVGKKYASDYMAICRWVADKVIKSNPKPKPEYKEPEETPVSPEMKEMLERQYRSFGIESDDQDAP